MRRAISVGGDTFDDTRLDSTSGGSLSISLSVVIATVSGNYLVQVVRRWNAIYSQVQGAKKVT